MVGRGQYRFCVICQKEFEKLRAHQSCCSTECYKKYRKIMIVGAKAFRPDLMSVVGQLFLCAGLIDKYGNPEIIGWEEWRNNRRQDIA
jgi:hypothetical protein